MHLNDGAATAVEPSSRLCCGRTLYMLYVLYALFVGVFLVFATPPFQTPDAIAHFERAIQISSGTPFGQKFDGTSGGEVDKSAIEFSDIYSVIPFHPDVKATNDMRQRADRLRWSDSTERAVFPNTSIYPAYTYVPQGIVIALGRAFDLKIRDVYIAVCLVDLLISVSVTAWAIAIAPRVAPLLFALALLPSTLMIYSSVSQEITILPLCLLLAAYIDRFSASGQPLSASWRWRLVAILAVCASARPPYAGLLFLFFIPTIVMDEEGAYRFGRRIVLFLACAAASVAGIVLFGFRAWSNFGPEHSVAGQLSYLLHTPSAVVSIAVETLRVQGAFYFTSFVGILGWLDTFLGVGYYKAAFVMLIAALLSVALRDRESAPPRAMQRMTILIPLLISIAMIFGSLYLAWTPVQKNIVDGVQGRYFLALAPLLGIAIPAIGASGSTNLWPRMRLVAMTCVVLFPCYTFVRLIEAVIDRFYLH